MNAENPTTDYVNPYLFWLSITVVCAIMAALIILFVGVVYAGVVVPRYERAWLTNIETSYLAGDYERVIELHRSKISVPFMQDSYYGDNPFRGLRRGMPAPSLIQVGEAYAHSGQHSVADRLYLQAVGWSQSQYRGWCLLNDGCAPISEIAQKTVAQNTSQ